MIRIRHTYTCDATGCGERHETDWCKTDLPWEDPSTPDGWTRVGVHVYCSKHRVIVQVCTDDIEPIEMLYVTGCAV